MKDNRREFAGLGRGAAVSYLQFHLLEIEAMRGRLSLLCLFTMLVPSGTLFAADLPAEAAIRAVTVFPDRAEVTRVVDATLPAGATTLVIDHLPASLLPDSVRVSGEGADSVTIGSVETKPFFQVAAVGEQERQLQEDIQKLQDQRRSAEDRVAALQVQLDFIGAIGREMPNRANDQIVRDMMDPERWQQAWSALGGGVAQARDGIHAAEIEMRDIDARIAQKNQELGQIRTGQTASMTARINLEAKAPGSVHLRLSYQLPGATWQPIYDARLDTEAGKVGLTEIGEVQQQTGEDWSGVKLTLSTARPAVGAELPDPSTWFISLAQAAAVSGALSDTRAVDEAVRKAQATLASVAEGQSNRIRDDAATLVVGEFAAEYKISGDADVPADAAPHKFVIAAHQLDAKLAVRTVPRLMPGAHLYATVAYDGIDPLLPGPLSVFRDGAFIGNSSLAMLRPKEEIELGFGIDDKVRIDYRLEDGQQSTAGIFETKQHLDRHYRIEVANHHGKPIEVTVLDQLPVSQDERVDVELWSGTTKPSKQDWQDRKGVLAWTDSYAPDEKRVIRFGYGVTYPEGVAVAGL